MAAQPACSAQSSARPAPNGASIFWFATTTLLGAFLVFQVQPVISKCVLPWFGGTPAVWTTCMLFFQLLLFGGYAYAHLLRTLCRPWLQGVLHLTLLCSAALALPIEPSAEWKPSGNESPATYLLWMLAVHVGLPYFVLSSTGPLIQSWLSYRDDSDRVYRLYALSNAGSLLALLSYPFLVEPLLSVSHQSVVWSLMFCVFVLLQGFLAIGLLRVRTAMPAAAGAREATAGAGPTWKLRITWIALPAFASSMLLVVTNHVCQDVAVIPFLWVLPLSLYLLSFIICFDSPQWYKPKLTAALTLAAIAVIQAKDFLPGRLELITEVTSYMGILLGICLLCHGEVARLKPRAKYITQFYMLLSGGGAAGGFLVAVLCPAIFHTHLEHRIAMAVVTGFSFMMFFAARGILKTHYDWTAAYRLRYGAVLLVLAPLLIINFVPQDELVASERNFFGVLKVTRDEKGTRLVHGTTIHGMQLWGKNAMVPTTYYGEQSGVGIALRVMQQRDPSLRIGVVGLGCGVLAAFGRDNDEFDMIEINPAVVDIANKYFSFLSRCRSTIRTHIGDGRLVLERMENSEFDMLILDAFSSDAIPAHLLTREAVELYKNRLADDGVLVIHVSNNHLDLVPLVHRLAHATGLESRVVLSKRQHDGLEAQNAIWVLLANQSNEFWQHAALRQAKAGTAEQLENAPIWTDQHHNLVSVLRLW